ncbi:hypothetical protein ACFL2E_06860 [Thermodesulfobacteriota bacterium]
MMQTSLMDNSERRSEDDRRHFSYAFHIPERRTGKERRNSADYQEPR